jgi:hypothetical protein
MSIINAKRYDVSDRYLLIRRRHNQDTNEKYWVWCHPTDGSVHGTDTTKYVKFTTLDDAVQQAESHGYSYEIDC